MHPTQNTAEQAQPPVPTAATLRRDRCGRCRDTMPPASTHGDICDGCAETLLAADRTDLRPLPVAPIGVNVGEILCDAALYLVRHGWIQGAYYDPTATVFTPAACAVGAIGMVCYGGPVDAPAQHYGEAGFEQFEAAVAWLDWYLTLTHGVVCYEFNDARGHTRIEVTAALYAAADCWDRTRGGVA